MLLPLMNAAGIRACVPIKLPEEESTMTTFKLSSPNYRYGDAYEGMSPVTIALHCI